MDEVMYADDTICISTDTRSMKRFLHKNYPLGGLSQGLSPLFPHHARRRGRHYVRTIGIPFAVATPPGVASAEVYVDPVGTRVHDEQHLEDQFLQ